MRLYVFTHMQTTGIHAGIQALHAAVEMQRKYEVKAANGDSNSKLKKHNLDVWADHHKTVWVKNGGNHDSLNRLYQELTQFSADMLLPISKFRESSMNNCTTAVAIVVPESVYLLGEFETLDSLEYKLAALLRKYHRFSV